MLSIEKIKPLVENLSIKSPRLHIRRFKPSDVDIEIKQQQNPQVMRFIREPQTEQQARANFESMLAPWQANENDWLGLCVERLSDGQSVGSISFRFESIDFAIAEIGYRFIPEFQGHGYASEAVKALIELLLCECKLHKIVAKCDPVNVGSYKLMERLGMQREAHLRQHYKIGEQYSDELIYGLLGAEYQV